MTGKVCPFCGAGPDPESPKTHYACGNPTHPLPHYYRAIDCYEREVDALKSQLNSIIIQRNELMEQVLNLRGIPTNPADDPLVCLACFGAPTEHICPPPTDLRRVIMRREDLEILLERNPAITLQSGWHNKYWSVWDRVKAALEEK
jgi:hypothetical protein